MSGTECKCINPDSGITKCPAQHIALCIRGKDRKCYSECVPIPNQYNEESPSFLIWLDTTITQKVLELVSDSEDITFYDGWARVEKIDEGHTSKGFKSTYEDQNSKKIHVQYNYSFTSNDFRAGSNMRESEV